MEGRKKSMPWSPFAKKRLVASRTGHFSPTAVERARPDWLRQDQLRGAGNSSFCVLGTRVDAIETPAVIKKIEEWIAAGDQGRFISVTNVNTIMQGRSDSSFSVIVNNSDLSVPDGMPLVWLGRLHGYALRERVAGPDLLPECCRKTQNAGYRHFFYGSAEGVAKQLASELKCQFPGIRVAGTYSPPFRQLTQEEDQHIIQMINQAHPDVLWVGLGCPKQERWIYEHRNRLQVAVMIGVGQAFDIHAGRLRRAPAYMRNHGLEWLCRLLLEPRRLWRRYLIYNSKFICDLLLESLHSGFRERST
jgi:N-acetylglucosaminyldiphosphoundecaprenol N-acetyl-beta-D-mannosaminyltransferase